MLLGSTHAAVIAGSVAHIGGAVAAAVVTAWLASRRERFGPAGNILVLAMALTAGWSLTVAAMGAGATAASIMETLRNLAWLGAVYRLFASDGRHTGLRPIRPLLVVLAIVEVLHLAFDLLVAPAAQAAREAQVAFGFMVMFRLLVTVGGLVLVHNLYAGGSRQSRAWLRWPAAGLGALWLVDLNFYAIAYLSADWPSDLTAVRGASVIALAMLLMVGASKDRDALRFRPSRAVTFQTFSLLVIGAYLLGMIAIAQWLSLVGGNFARLMELAFLIVASAAAILVLPSRRLRGWLKVMLSKHFFLHRYDYREEWLRFTRTIGGTGDADLPLGERVVQAVADVADSPAGLLLTLGEGGGLTLAARWRWQAIEVPAEAIPAASVRFFQREEYIADLDDWRAGKHGVDEGAALPEWLREEARAWALVPLIHYERLVGLVVLARPPMPRRFDWEDFDLLRLVGRQAASYLAENAVQEALAEASRFDDFHRRIAFVMHDIKNLASQLSLLSRNAEVHADKPAFRADMLLTLKNSSDKLNTLLARLSRYGGGMVDRIAEVAASDIAKSAIDRFRGMHNVMLVETHECLVLANREALEQVLVHLIQNGVDASSAGSPVFLSLTCDGIYARFEVVDSGTGMSADFVRSRLFKPFVSSKPGGFGIGAFEARELVRAMQGRLDVESREGLGSRFVVRIPAAGAGGIVRSLADPIQKAAS